MDQKKTEIFAILKRRIKLFLKRVSIYKRPNSGSSLILLLFFALPVLLFGTKYVLDMRTLYKVKIGNSDAEADRKTAKAAALELAQNWNPGLTFKQQEAAAFKIVDAVYRNYISITNLAIPGLDTYRYKKVNKNYGEFAPLEVKQELISPQRNFVHTKKKKYITDYRFSPKSSWNSNYMLWKSIDNATNPKYRQSCFDEVNEKGLERGEYFLDHHDISISPMVFQDSLLLTTPNLDNNYLTYLRDLGSESNPAHTGSHTEYYKDPTMAITTSIGVDKDSIAVTLGSNDTGYAVPAECNVDIVLAIPVNGAASNRYNEDAASDNPGTPVNSVNQIEKTPIYEMGQACKAFVKDNFYHTRGVNMGLIPYSAKVSVAPDKWNSYTSEIPKFSDSYFQNNPTSTKKMIGAVLYGSYGQKNQKLSTAYDRNNALMSYPIMCRRGETFTAANSKYGTNEIAKGILLSNADPSSDARLRYRRMKLNPCYSGYANMLSLRCDKTCETYNPNPYYMIEPTADMVKIYEMCNALFPVYDLRNVSNFLFIPIEWANNFFQAWTRDPSETENVATDKLSLQSKKKQGRKKVLILLVNKPDWFEPGELTYLGFDNDYSDVSTYESDKIDFSINYSDTSKRFLDADKTRFDGTIAGAKRLLRFATVSGSNPVRRNEYYEVSDGKYRLKFPQKGSIKLTVEPCTTGGSGSITFYNDNIGSTYDVRRDGNSITLGQAQTITSTQRYIFSGGKMPDKGAYISGINSTQGKNFSHNLCVKKVRYSVSNAKISDCVLKQQIIRDYTSGLYGYSQSSLKPLILQDGSTSPKNSGGQYGIQAWYSSWANGTLVPRGSTNYNTLCKYRDPCVSTSSETQTYYVGWGWLGVGGTHKYPVYVVINGVSPNFVIAQATGNSGYVNCYYYTSSGYRSVITGASDARWDNQYLCTIPSGYSSSAIKLKFEDITNSGDGGFWQYVVQNQNDKTLKNTEENPIRSNPLTYSDLIANKGVYLAEYGGQKWICFQGDGELHVTVSTQNGIKFNNITSFKGESNDYAFRPLLKTKTFYIEPSAISDNRDGNDYYVEFEAKACRLISAEISNRQLEVATPNSGLSGETKSTGGIEKEVYVNTNYRVPLTIRAKSTRRYGTVTFYNTNGVQDNVGTYTLTVPRTFTFEGGSLSTYGYTRGRNFGNNYSIDKIKYSVNNASITAATIEKNKQILRWDSSGKDPGLAVYATTSEQSSYNSSYYNYWTIVVMNLSDIYARWYTTPRTWTTTEYYDCNPYTEYYDCNPYTEYYDCNCYNYSCNCGYHDCDCRNESYTYSCGESRYWEYNDTWTWSLSSNDFTSDIYNSTYRKYGWYPGYYYCGNSSKYANWSTNGGPHSCSSGTRVVVYSYEGSNRGQSVDYYCRTRSLTCTGTRRVCSSCYSCSTCRSCSRCSRTRYRTCSRTRYRTCSKQVGRGGDGNMYYSALNTANARSGYDIYNNRIPRNTSSTMSSYYLSVPNTQAYANYRGAGGQSAVFFKVNPTGDYLNYFYATNNGRKIEMESSGLSEGGMDINALVKNNLRITFDSNYIKFNGDSTINVTVTPSVADGYIYYKNASQSNSSYAVSSDLYTTVSIDPTTHYYEKVSGGYRITLKLKDVELDTSYGAKLVSTPEETIYEYKKIDKSGNNRRYIEYQNSNGVTYDSSKVFGDFSTFWDSFFKMRSIMSSGPNQISNIKPLEFAGDIVHEMEDTGSKPAYANLNLGDESGDYYVPGTTRLFTPVWRDTINKMFGVTERSGRDSTQSGGILNLLTTDITYPVNSVLLEGGYQTVSNGVPKETPTQAAMKVTALACAKLKQDYGNNLQIHIVKYRKQQMYKDFSQNNKYHNYSVIDSCATPGAYVVDATSEDQLKAALRVIAEDIKEFAGYKTAQNVDV